MTAQPRKYRVTILQPRPHRRGDYPPLTTPPNRDTIMSGFGHGGLPVIPPRAV